MFSRWVKHLGNDLPTMKATARLIYRIKAATLSLPGRRSWLIAGGLLVVYGLVYLPIGFGLGFLKLDIQTNGWTIVSVLVSSFLMPGISEELLFRVLLIPHSTESMNRGKRSGFIVLSWVLFLFWHLHPFVPSFFATLGFLIGAGLVGIVCTISYLQSASLWTPVVIHWVIVANWLLLLGGLEKFGR